jgi:GNAT superfamily N-acetyltransferase
MPVREAVPADLDEICALIGELAEFEQASAEVAFDPAELSHHLFGPDPAACVLIAEPIDQPGVVAGMALWYRTFSTWVGRPGVWLEDLFVRPDYRGQGLAAELLSGLSRESEGRLECAVLDWNRPAIALYERSGGRPVEGWTRYRWPAGGVSPAEGPST